MLELNVMNAERSIKLPEQGDTDARAESVGEGCVIMVAGRAWFVDLADLMEQRIPGMSCGKCLEAVTLAE